jgi:hypothetical protein
MHHAVNRVLTFFGTVVRMPRDSQPRRRERWGGNCRQFWGLAAAAPLPLAWPLSAPACSIVDLK